MLRAWTRLTGLGSRPVPDAIALTGNVFVLDGAGSTVLAFSPLGRPLAAWGHSGVLTDRALAGAGGIAATTAGSVYVTNYEQGRIVKLTPAGRIDRHWVGGSQQIALTDPQGIAVDRIGKVYVADQGNSRIQVLSPAGALETLWRRQDTSGGVQAPYPYGVAVDPRGRVYVTDALADSLTVYSRKGRLRTRRKGGRDGFRSPEGVAVMDDGSAVVADTGNNRVQVLDASGSVRQTLSTAGGLHLSRPGGVATDGKGTVYVADTGNHRIVRFNL